MGCLQEAWRECHWSTTHTVVSKKEQSSLYFLKDNTRIYKLKCSLTLKCSLGNEIQVAKREGDMVRAQYQGIPKQPLPVIILKGAIAPISPVLYSMPPQVSTFSRLHPKTELVNSTKQKQYNLVMPKGSRCFCCCSGIWFISLATDSKTVSGTISGNSI